MDYKKGLNSAGIPIIGSEWEFIKTKQKGLIVKHIDDDGHGILCSFKPGVHKTVNTPNWSGSVSNFQKGKYKLISVPGLESADDDMSSPEDAKIIEMLDRARKLNGVF